MTLNKDLQLEIILAKYPLDAQIIDLNHKNLTEINCKVFSKYTKLTDLYLNNNKLTVFDCKGLPDSLKYLWLYNNKLTLCSFSDLPKNLEFLLLYNNKLTVFDYKDLPESLVVLDLSSNKLTEFYCKDLPDSLKYLYLSNNELNPEYAWDYIGEEIRVFLETYRTDNIGKHTKKAKN